MQAKKAVKIGNWQEELALKEMTGGKYDPRVRNTSTLTRERCIVHSNQVSPKEYKSTLGETYLDPKVDTYYVPELKKGPRERELEQDYRARAEAEHKLRLQAEEDAKQTRYLSSTARDFFGGPDKKLALRDYKSPQDHLPAHIHHSSDPPITYYLHTAMNSDNITFPVTAVTNLANPFTRAASVSADIKDSTSRINETFESPTRLPTIKEYRVLRKLRERVIQSFSSHSTCSGYCMRTFAHDLWSMSAASGKVSIEAFAAELKKLTDIDVTQDEIDSLLIAFGRDAALSDGEGIVGVYLDQVVQYFRSRLNDFRNGLVTQAFDKCDTNLRGVIGKADIRSNYDAASVVRLKNANIAPHVYFDDFMDILTQYQQSSAGITLDTFVEYYRDVSSEIIEDDDFEKLLEVEWSL